MIVLALLFSSNEITLQSAMTQITDNNLLELVFARIYILKDHFFE
jgi:hypothetical protein